MPSITDHDDIPIEGAVKLHPDLCMSFDPNEPDVLRSIWIWHWCTHSVWKAKAEAANYEGWAPKDNLDVWKDCWRAAGVSAHQLVSLDPVHLEPSLFWPDCCGMHGFLRGGLWAPV